ncbi:MAG: hypothetical protein FWF72_02350 [Paludibacter sp.]|nr:hypothetical protein [Paludibacter sp.]
MSQTKFEKLIGLSNGYINNIKVPSEDVLQKINLNFPDLNFHWLFTGKGKMVLVENSQEMGNPDGYKDKYICELEDNKQLRIQIIELLRVMQAAPENECK